MSDLYAPLTEEQCERLVQWHRKRLGKEVVPAFQAMQQLQTQDAESQAELDRVSAGILALVEGRDE